MKILVVEQHAILREGLRTLLDAEAGFEVVGEAADGLSALALVKEVEPDLVITAVALRTLNGVQMTQRIREAHPKIAVVALSVLSDPRSVGRMLSAGASAYLPRDSSFDELKTALGAVSAGRVYLSPRLGGGLVQECLDLARQADASLLTQREREVLQLLTEGRSTKQIAALLEISAKTVETHRAHIMAKLDLHSVADLTKYAIREGLTSL